MTSNKTTTTEYDMTTTEYDDDFDYEYDQMVHSNHFVEPGYEIVTYTCDDCDRTWTGPAHLSDGADVAPLDGRTFCDEHFAAR